MAAPATTYSELAPPKRRQMELPTHPEATRRAPRRPEGGQSPNPRGLSDPRGSGGTDGGLRWWSVGSWAAPHGRVELIAVVGASTFECKRWCGAGLGGFVVPPSSSWASGDIQGPLGCQLGWWRG